MGIRGLYSFIYKRFPHSFTRHLDLNAFRNKRVAIDAMIYIHKYKATCEDLRVGWLKLLLALKAYNISVTCIYDSDRPNNALKTGTILSRSKTNARRRHQVEEFKTAITQYKTGIETDTFKHLRYKYNKHMIHTFVDIDAIEQYVKKMERQVKPIERCNIENTQYICSLLGIPFITAPAESDKLCAYLFHNRQVDYIVSDDSDFLAYGCSILRNITTHSPNITALEGNIYTIMGNMTFTKKQLLWFCIGLGTDYNPPPLKIPLDVLYLSCKNNTRFNDLQHIYDYFSCYDDMPTIDTTQGTIQTVKLVEYIHEMDSTFAEPTELIELLYKLTEMKM